MNATGMPPAGDEPAAVVICSKSRWWPPNRREHMLARQAAREGHRVLFVEQPLHLQDGLRRGARSWLHGFRPASRRLADGLTAISWSTIAPGHRGGLASALETGLLKQLLSSHGDAATTIVATTPWQWRAAMGVDGSRRIFDCADDWTRVMPSRGRYLARLYQEVEVQADAIIVNAPGLRGLFGARSDITVVRNGTAEEMLEHPVALPPPGLRSLAYAGTLSERFDVPLIHDVMERLPDWRLSLYGECRYAGRGDRPGDELQRLLDEFPGRVEWDGVVPREELWRRLDDADVLILPHRPAGAVTGDAMKLYDYAARGRPIISTAWSDDLDQHAPPHLSVARDVAEWTAAIRSASKEPPAHASDRRAWAESNRWSSRWADWSRVALRR